MKKFIDIHDCVSRGPREMTAARSDWIMAGSTRFNLQANGLDMEKRSSLYVRGVAAGERNYICTEIGFCAGVAIPESSIERLRM